MYILHEIITTAQQTDDSDVLPFRAIFSAYPVILARHGLHPDHDSIYLRFLLRLGDKRIPGQSLFEAFEALLAEFGIQLEFEPQEDVTSGMHSGNNTSGNDALAFRNPTVSHGASRKTSFSSTKAASHDNPRSGRRRSTSRASLSQIETTTRIIPENRPSTRATNRPTERTQSTNAHRNRDFVLPEGGRLTDSQFTRNIQHQRRRHASVSSRGSHEASKDNVARRRSIVETHPHSVSSNPESIQDFDETTQNQSDSDIQSNYIGAPSNLLYHPSDTQLERDANLFHHVYTQSISRKVFRRWRRATETISTDHRAMMTMAMARDADILRRQAFEQWRIVYMVKKHAIETERFFSHLERKANKARNLYLLTKAFTHWAECASDELRRTSVARRHILRTRYFNAWKEITVVNDLKVRRQGLRKFFSLWTCRINIALASKHQAVTVYHHNLVRSIYWRWFWNFCETRAPEWKAARLKKQLFLRWRLRVYSGIQRYMHVDALLKANLQRRCLLHWLDKAQKVLTFGPLADSFRARMILAKSLLVWRLECQHLPIARRISTMVDWRIAYSVFSVLLQRYTIGRRAGEVSRQRVVRNSWTQWNDRLRVQMLVNRIDDRVLVQALYKWVLAERYILLQRLSEKRLLQRSLHALTSRWDYLAYHHARNQKAIEARRRGRQFAFAMQKWRSRMDLHRQREQLAHEYIAPRVRQNTLQLWITCHAHLQKLDDWAKNAVDYFRTYRIFKLWQEAVIGSRKQKRRHAYTQLRRKVKTNMARGVIRQWRAEVSHISEMKQTSTKISQRRLLTFGIAIFDQWRQRFTFLTERSGDVDMQYRVKLLQQSLQNWGNEFRERQEHIEESHHFARLHVFKVVHDCLQTLQLNVFKMGSREQVATSVKARNEKRHYHNLFHTWRVKTAQKRGLPAHTDFPLTARSRRFAPPRVDETTALHNIQGGPAIDDEFDLNDWTPVLDTRTSTTTPIPAYLNTPSKRAARAKALVRLPLATPAQVKLPPATPATPAGGFGSSYQRILKGQAATDPRGVVLFPRGSDLGQSLGAKGGQGGRVGFDDIPEGSRTGSSTLGTS